MKKKAIVAGHICIDITPVFGSGRVDRISDILKPGKLIQMNGVDVHTGGAVANTGLAMKILGADVSLMGKIGNDEFGGMIRDILRKYDADDGLIVSDSDNSSYSVVLAVPGIDRIFLHDPGANNTFSSIDVDPSRLDEVSLFHFGYPPLMAKMYANDGQELVSMFRQLKERGIATSLDMAAVDPGTEAGRAGWDKILKNVLPYVDFFVPSVEELCFMIDRERFESWQAKAGDNDITELLDPEKDIMPLADRCLEYGAKVVLVKSGAPGLFCKTSSVENIDRLCDMLGLNTDKWASYTGFERSYVPEKIVSGTGAGDTSIAAFLTAMLNGEDLEECLHLAAGTGACCVAAIDALSGLVSLDTLKAKIAAGWSKNVR